MRTFKLSSFLSIVLFFTGCVTFQYETEYNKEEFSKGKKRNCLS